MSEKARLRIALPPGWATVDKEALIASLDESFPSLDYKSGEFYRRLTSPDVHLVAFLPSPAKGKIGSILTVTVLKSDVVAPDSLNHRSVDWSVSQWSGSDTIGKATSIVRATRAFDLAEDDEQGLVTLYAIGFQDGELGASIVTLTKLHKESQADVIAVLDEIAETVSVGPLDRE